MPCRNEEKYIRGCLDSVIANDFPKELLTVMVIDGMSTDRTREIVKEYAERYPFIRLLDNPDKVQTFATNIGINECDDSVILRMDAHAEYPIDYISKSVSWIEKEMADCVGGVCVTKPGGDTAVARAIALALSHPFGVGNSYFRIGSQGPKDADTVPFGCYRKEVFDTVGLFNENLNRTDDLEFNLRMKRAGGKILLVPEIQSFYYARSNLRDLARQNFGNGFWVVYSLAYANLPFSFRHLVPFVFVSALIGSLMLSFLSHPFIILFGMIAGLYSAANTFFSLSLSLKHGLKYFPFLVASFATLHFSYGLGSLWGMVKLGYKKILHS